MNLLGLEETLGRLAKANGVRWYGQVLKKDDGAKKSDRVSRVGKDWKAWEGPWRPKMAEREGW